MSKKTTQHGRAMHRRGCRCDICVLAEKIYQAEYGKNNRKRLSEYLKKYKQEHLDRIREQQNEYTLTHKLEKSEYDKERYRKNKAEIIARSRSHYLKNRDKIHEREREKYAANREFYQKRQRVYNARRHPSINTKIALALRASLRARLKVRLQGGKHISHEAVTELGCTLEEFISWTESQFDSGMNWDNWGLGDGKWQIDHIIPLRLFDLTDSKQRSIACHYTNLRPLWHEVNNRRRRDGSDLKDVIRGRKMAKRVRDFARSIIKKVSQEMRESYASVVGG